MTALKQAPRIPADQRVEMRADGDTPSLQRHRAARIGVMRDEDLAQAMGMLAGGTTVEDAARAIHCPVEALRLRMMCLGVPAVLLDDRQLTLADAAALLEIDVHQIFDGVQDGLLSAEPVGSARALTDQWLTSDRRLAAWLIASPERIPLCAPHAVAGMLMCAGAHVAQSTLRP